MFFATRWSGGRAGSTSTSGGSGNGNGISRDSNECMKKEIKVEIFINE